MILVQPTSRTAISVSKTVSIILHHLLKFHSESIFYENMMVKKIPRLSLPLGTAFAQMQNLVFEREAGVALALSSDGRR